MADSQEDIFNNDVDPLDGIRALRKEESAEPGEAVEEVSDDASLEDDEITDTSDDKSADEAEADEPAAEAADNAEGDAEDVEYDAPADNPPEVKHKFKANGQEFEFTQEEMLDRFQSVFAQAMDYTRKTQAIAPYRKMISAIEEQKITSEQLNLAIDALKGDKGAIKQLIDKHGIDSYDLSQNEELNSYSPNEYGKDEATLNLQEVVNTISSDAEYSVTADVVQNRWDINSQQQLASNPDMLQGLHNDVKTGVFDQVAPLAAKMKVYDGNTKSDIEYYMLAGQQLQQQKEATNSANLEADKLNKQTQDAVAEADRASSEADKKRSASSTARRSDRTVIDYLDDDDEAFDEWYKKTMSSQ